MVVDAALQEDAQVIGLSLHSGAHMTLFPAVVEELQRREATDIVVFGGGIIPDQDITELKGIGVAQIFPPGTPLQDIVGWLHQRFPENAPEAPGGTAPLPPLHPPPTRLSTPHGERERDRVVRTSAWEGF